MENCGVGKLSVCFLHRWLSSQGTREVEERAHEDAPSRQQILFVPVLQKHLGGFSPKIDVLAFLLCLLETTACLSSWSVPEDADSRGLGLSARLLVGLGLDSVQGRHPQEMEMQRGEGSGGSFPCFL